MLSKEDNEFLCRVGPGTPMGNLLRQYWMPFIKSEDLEADGAPKRVKLLGEDLIAFRDTNGAVGLIQNNCPHRGASLFFGRNEEAGIRCVYHGWKFDLTGHCVDMPNEPAESDSHFPENTCIHPCSCWASPTGYSRSKAIWIHRTSIGSTRRSIPPASDWARTISTGDPASKWYRPSTGRSVRRRAHAAATATKCGIASRSSSCPSMMIAADNPKQVHVRAWVPLDDYHNLEWHFMGRIDRPVLTEEGAFAKDPYGAWHGWAEETSDPLTRYATKANIRNDFLFDRALQKELYVGVPFLVNLQDRLATEPMGAINERLRPASVLLDPGDNWIDATEASRSVHPDADLAAIPLIGELISAMKDA